MLTGSYNRSPLRARRHGDWCFYFFRDNTRLTTQSEYARRPLSQWIDMWQTMQYWSSSRSSRRFLLWFPGEYGVRVWTIQGVPRASACARRTQTQSIDMRCYHLNLGINRPPLRSTSRRKPTMLPPVCEHCGMQNTRVRAMLAEPLY